MKYAIIGASAAGLSAAKTLRENDRSCEIQMFTAESYLPYSRPIISYYLKDSIPADKIYLNDENYYTEQNIGIRTNTEITAIDAKNHKLLFNGGEYVFDKCLIATGSNPFVPPVENTANKDNVFTFLDMASAEKIKAAATKNTKAVVIGAGLIGLKAAEGLRKIAGSVTVVELADKVLPSVLDAEAALIVKNHLNKNGITTLLGDTVESALGESSVTAVKLKSGKTLPCNLLVIAVGVRPNTALAENAGIAVNRGIVVDSKTMETSISDIFAAGDCVNSLDILDEKEKIIALWPNAVRQGKTAALHMCKKGEADEGSFAVNAIDFFGLRICTCGLINTAHAEEIKSGEAPVYKRLLVQNDKLVGFVLLNCTQRAGIYTDLIKNKIALSSLAGNLKDTPSLMLFKNEIRTQKLTGGAAI